MTQLRLTWHQYKYFPYERELALREAATILRSDRLEESDDGVLVGLDHPLERIKRLTYFAGLKNGSDIASTTQRQLEADANGMKSRQSTRYSVHGLHEYKGKFNPQVAKALMNIFDVHEQSRILDPFCGSGTTLVEAAQIGATAVGTDLNPFAVFLANAKQDALRTPASELRTLLSKIAKKSNGKGSVDRWTQAKTARLEYLRNWFDVEQLRLIETLRLETLRACGEHAPIFLVIASDLLREYSLQDPNDLRIRRRKTPLPTTPFWEAFGSRAEEIIRRIESAQSVLINPLGKAHAVLRSCETLRPRTLGAKFDCAITSPPYAMALPYIDTQRLSLVWLGLIEPQSIMSLESDLIGSREMRGQSKAFISSGLSDNEENLPAQQIALCRKLLEALGADDGFRRRAVPLLLYRYFGAMRRSFSAIRSTMKIGAPYALIVGHNHTTIGGERFDINTPHHLAQIAQSAGWWVDELIPLQTYQRYGYHMANAVASETLLILRNK